MFENVKDALTKLIDKITSLLNKVFDSFSSLEGIVTVEVQDKPVERLCRQAGKREGFNPDLIVLSRSLYSKMYIPDDSDVEEGSTYIPMSGEIDFTPPRTYKSRDIGGELLVTWSDEVETAILLESNAIS